MDGNLPEISHLQAAILSTLGPRDLSGKELREALKAVGQSKTGPAFYQLMARLEEARFVTGRYDEKIVEGQRIKERRYVLTGEGSKALTRAGNFYGAIVANYGQA